jgi:hypothetical protein
MCPRFGNPAVPKAVFRPWILAQMRFSACFRTQKGAYSQLRTSECRVPNFKKVHPPCFLPIRVSSRPFAVTRPSPFGFRICPGRLRRHLDLFHHFIHHVARRHAREARLRFHHQPMGDDRRGQFLDLFGRHQLQAVEQRERLRMTPTKTYDALNRLTNMVDAWAPRPTPTPSAGSSPAPIPRTARLSITPTAPATSPR